MIPSKDDPLRPPDWRWLRANWLRNNGKWCRKAIDDPETKLIKRYQTAKALCTSELQLERLMYKMPGLFHAEQFHGREDLDLRWEMEARFLARESFEDIAKKIGVAVEVVFWYERAFYNVTEKLDNQSYIGTVAMRKSIHRGINERDYDLLWKMLGYACGPLMVDSVTRKLAGAQRVDATDQVDATKRTLIDSVMADKALTTVMTMHVSYNQGVILDYYARILEIAKDSGKGGDITAMITTNINAALTALPFSTERPAVAAPQLAYYDNQSAELRADELLAVGMGQDSQALREAVQVTFSGAKDGDNAKDKQGN